MTQQEKIKLMLADGWVSPMDALKESGCMRLGARIHELKSEGVDIEERWQAANGKFGKCRWKEFRIVAKEEPNGFWSRFYSKFGS